MQQQIEATPWHHIKTQITRLRLFEQRIEDLRSLLAEDWQIRVSLHAADAAAGNYPRPSDAVRVDHSSSHAFSAC
jgi:hypothetical protein